MAYTIRPEYLAQINSGISISYMLEVSVNWYTFHCISLYFNPNLFNFQPLCFVNTPTIASLDKNPLNI